MAYGAANLGRIGELGLRLGVRPGLEGIRRYPWLLTL